MSDVFESFGCTITRKKDHWVVVYKEKTIGRIVWNIENDSPKPHDFPIYYGECPEGVSESTIQYFLWCLYEHDTPAEDIKKHRSELYSLYAGSTEFGKMVDRKKIIYPDKRYEHIPISILKRLAKLSKEDTAKGIDTSRRGLSFLYNREDSPEEKDRKVTAAMLKVFTQRDNY